MDRRNLLILLLAVALTWVVADRGVRARRDGGGGDEDRDLIAVTGSFGSGASALYLIDTKTRHMAVYRLENGRHLEFVSARDCNYDFMLETYNDRSPQGYLPASLRQSWERFARSGGAATKGIPTPSETADKSGVDTSGRRGFVLPEVKAEKIGGPDGAAPAGTKPSSGGSDGR